MQSIEHRYRTDPAIRALVESLEQQIHKLQFTPSEIRECAMLAAINYERRKPLDAVLTDERGFRIVESSTKGFKFQNNPIPEPPPPPPAPATKANSVKFTEEQVIKIKARVHEKCSVCLKKYNAIAECKHNAYFPGCGVHAVLEIAEEV